MTMGSTCSGAGEVGVSVARCPGTGIGVAKSTRLAREAEHTARRFVRVLAVQALCALLRIRAILVAPRFARSTAHLASAILVLANAARCARYLAYGRVGGPGRAQDAHVAVVCAAYVAHPTGGTANACDLLITQLIAAFSTILAARGIFRSGKMPGQAPSTHRAVDPRAWPADATVPRAQAAAAPGVGTVSADTGAAEAVRCPRSRLIHVHSTLITASLRRQQL